jgi:hypothetical protein
MGNTDGCWRSMVGVISVKLFVQASADSTCWAVIIRVLRYAPGANCINQLLYKSTDRAISCFHKWGLSALTGTTFPLHDRLGGFFYCSISIPHFGQYSATCMFNYFSTDNERMPVWKKLRSLVT